jgi:predicted enzyme related to lactoylglutathione lyase
MPLGAIRTVYTVANDMDLMQAFYAGALELPLAFRDRDNWCQFKAGQVSFALSSPLQTARGARGSMIVFAATDVAAFAQRFERLGGRHISSRWARTATSRRLPTPRTTCSNCMSGPATSPAQRQQCHPRKDAHHEIWRLRSE